MFKTPTHNGFTLIELMLTILIVSIVLAIATPSFRTSIQNSRIKSQVNVISSAIAYAQSEAVKTQTTTLLCGSDNGNNCNTSNLAQGWIVFVDLNGDLAPGGIVDGYPEIRRVGQGVDLDSITIHGGSSSTSITFDDGGALSSGSATFTLCDDRGVTDARALIVNLGGQARLAVDEDASADDIVNRHDGSNAVCP